MSKPVVLGGDIGFKLTPIGRKVIEDHSRFKIWKAGRRGSKTYTEAFFTGKHALIDRNRQKHWYVTTTLALAREEFFPVLLDLLPRHLVAKTDDRLLYVRLTNGSTIYCKSAEKEKNLRGRGLGSLVIDEGAFLRAGLWEQVLRPTLSGSEGPALLASSPKKGWFTQLYNRVVQEKLPNWSAFHSTIYDNPHIKREEIEYIKATTPINTWLQEYMAEEISEAGVVYDEFTDKNIYDPREKFQEVKTFATLRGLDWGTKDPAACIWLGIDQSGKLVISEEHEQNGKDPAWHAEIIHSKSNGYTRIHANILDSSAFRDESNLRSVADQFQTSGITCQPSTKDSPASIAITKRFLRGDETGPWLYVSAKCSRLITAFQNWEHGDHEPDPLAALRYAVAYAIAKRLTRLADVVPMVHHDQKPVSEEQAKYILAAEARVVTKRTAQGFAWDYSNGVPS